MKSYRSLVLAGASALIITGCAASDANMQMMKDMESQLQAMQFQLNSVEAAAATAKDMASEALTKASRNQSVIEREHGHRSMMK